VMDMKKKWLGVLINHSLWKGIKLGHTGHEKIEWYVDAADKYGLDVGFFRIQDVSLNSSRVRALLVRDGNWENTTLPLPAVIHNRAIYESKRILNRLRQLEDRQIPVFNGWNRYGKWQMYKILAEKAEFLRFLPDTAPSSLSGLHSFMEKYPSLLLKPSKGSVGEGIIKLDREDSGAYWKITYKSGKRLIVKVVPSRLVYTLLRKHIREVNYIIQETIRLASYQGALFDIRVSVQKNGRGEWQVTGVVGKVARAGHYLSNVAQGGKIVPLTELFKQLPHLDLSQFSENLQKTALKITHYLDGRLPHLADVGYDFGLDEEGRLYFIEMNSRDQRYSLSKVEDPDAWKRTYENPVAYARFLINKKEDVH
jgi:glutathione synthase/RimK-type ligase-like ATP-grasp enzyme